MKKIVLILLIILMSSFNRSLFAQTKIDSLKQVLKTLSTQKGYSVDTTKFNLLLDIGEIFNKTLPDSANIYYTKAKNLATEIGDEMMLAELSFVMAWNNYKKSNFDEALKHYTQTLNLAEKLIKSNSKKIKSTAFNFKTRSIYRIGVINLQQGRYPKALEYLFSSLKLNEELGRENELSLNYNVIGIVYMQEKKYKKAIEYFSKALKLNDSLNDKGSRIGIIVNIGSIYDYEGDSKKALYYYSNALKIAEEVKNKHLQSSINSNIGSLYLGQNNYKKALEYCNKAKELKEEIKDKPGLVITLHNIASIYNMQKKYKLAEEFTQRTLELAKEIESLEDIKLAYLNYSQIYQQTNRPALALENYKKYIIYRDSITNVENDKAIIQKELQYNYDKKATADSIVNAKAQEIKDAQLAKNKLEIKSKQNQQYALFGGLALVLVFAGFMYNRFKITQRQKIIIEEQKKLVDASQKKTMDSINYAKKIQHSILPSSEALGAIFPNHFIFFKPKDVVSGDFYWFHHQNNLSFIAVADCTGHGVPGAFMTMIGYSNLIEVVAQQKVIEPNKILENLHQHIFNNLQQNKGDAYSQDGMDISLVVIDHEKSLLHFSAAYNHGYLIHNKQMHTLKATSKSIGGLSILGEIEPLRHFKTETIPFTKGSLLILTTDGIFDQLNKQDEKFGNERFKELALNFNSENVRENLKLLEQTYNNWTQDSLQLDDLCLLGLII